VLRISHVNSSGKHHHDLNNGQKESQVEEEQCNAGKKETREKLGTCRSIKDRLT
jgi:hypothetical protein